MNFKNVENLNIYPKQCIGCQKNGGDFMLSFGNCQPEELPDDSNFLDIFLSREQLETLVRIAVERLKEEKTST